MTFINMDQPKKFSLRTAEIKDFNDITACVHNAFRHYIDRIGRKPGPMLMDYGREIREHQVSVVEVDDVIAGVIVLCIAKEGFLLDVIAVDPHYQGRGIGKLLLKFAETEARRQEYKSIYLYTHEKMTENQALYKAIGYVEFDRRIEHGLSRVYLRKQL